MTVPDAAISRRLGAREFAGYRVLRSLGGDERAELLLGHRAEASGESGGSTVVLKIVPATDDGWRSVSHECAALERARGEHVVDLLDVDADDRSIRLLFERLPRGDLAALLRVRDRIDAGEAVTVLAPLAGALARLHASGVAHGAFGPRSVLFRDNGAPVLTGFSRAEMFEPGAPEVVLESVDAVRRDRGAVRSLAITVLERVSGPRARNARELLGELEGCADEDVLALLAGRLFEVATAAPVRFTADDAEPDVAAASSRLVPLAPSAESTHDAGSGAHAVGEGIRSGPLGVLARMAPEPLVRRVLDAAERSPAAPLLRTVLPALRTRWRSWAPGRRRIVLAIGAAVVTVAVVMAVIPAGGASPAASGAPGTDGTAGAAEPSSSPPAGDPGGTESAIIGDDPLLAVPVLLQLRDRCLGMLSIPCLDGADESGSAASGGDAAVIRAGQQGGELPDPLATAERRLAPELVERLGDSALVRLAGTGSASAPPAASDGETTSASAGDEPGPQRGPASLLLVKGEAGWRIRDVIVAGDAGD